MKTFIKFRIFIMDFLYNSMLKISNKFFNDGSIKYHSSMLPIYTYLIISDMLDFIDSKESDINCLIPVFNKIDGYKFKYSAHKSYFEKNILFDHLVNEIKEIKEADKRFNE